MDVTEHMMATWDHEDLKSPGHITFRPLDSAPVILTPQGTPASYRPTLPPVVHDPANMRDHQVDLQSLYPKLSDLAAVEGAVWGKLTNDPIERALRRELQSARANCTETLRKLQACMAEQHDLQAKFNASYADIEHILEKHPELLKP